MVTVNSVFTPSSAVSGDIEIISTLLVDISLYNGSPSPEEQPTQKANKLNANTLFITTPIASNAAFLGLSQARFC
jgi:hypothetical protein